MFIKQSYTPEKVDTLLESFDILEDAQIEAYEDAFFDILMQHGDKEITGVPGEIEDLMIRFLLDIMVQHGVEISEDTPLSVMNAICDGLLGIQYYMSSDDISLVLESALDEEEKLSQILELVNGLDQHRALAAFERVDPGLLTKIEELVTSKTELDASDFERESENFKITKKLRDIVRFFSSQEFVAVKLINAGVVIGADFEQYIKYFVKYVEDMKPEDIAKEVFLLLTMSRDGYESMLQTYSKYTSRLFTDLDQTTKVFTALNKVVIDFDKYMMQRNALTKPIVVGVLNEQI